MASLKVFQHTSLSLSLSFATGHQFSCKHMLHCSCVSVCVCASVRVCVCVFEWSAFPHVSFEGDDH